MDYLTLDCWSIPEAAILLAGGTPVNESGVVSAADQRPLRPGELDILKDIRTRAFNSLDAGTLAYVGKRQHGLVAPSAFCRWAVGKGYDLPEKLRPLLGPAGRETESLARALAEVGGGQDPAKEAPTATGQTYQAKRTTTQKRAEMMERILSALCELDPDFDTKSMHGRKVDLLDMCKALVPRYFNIEIGCFEDTALKGRTVFLPGARGTTYYRGHLEAVRLKLGLNSPRPSRITR